MLMLQPYFCWLLNGYIVFECSVRWWHDGVVVLRVSERYRVRIYMHSLLNLNDTPCYLMDIKYVVRKYVAIHGN